MYMEVDCLMLKKLFYLPGLSCGGWPRCTRPAVPAGREKAMLPAWLHGLGKSELVAVRPGTAPRLDPEVLRLLGPTLPAGALAKEANGGYLEDVHASTAKLPNRRWAPRPVAAR